VRQDSASLLRGRAPHRFDVIFLDPPYAVAVEPLLALLPPWLSERGVVYVERPLEQGLPEVDGGAWWKRGHAGAVAYGLFRFRGAV
jgi:16S rRNA G966 N2-methylase RsmD